MSATSGRDAIKNGELQGDLDAKGFKIIDADLSESTVNPPDIPTIATTSAVLKGDNNGNAVAATAKTDFWDGTVAVASGASHAKGLVPDPGAVAGTGKFLREDMTYAVPAGTGAPTIASTTVVLKGDDAGNAIAAIAKTDFWDTTVFAASGASHAKGLVPDPGASAATTKYLREDSTWAVPPASSGVTIAVTSAVIKGDGAGGGVAATPGTDFVAPSTALTRLTATTQTVSGATPAINWNTSVSWQITLSADATFSFSNATDGWSIAVVVTNGASWTATWPTVKWPNGGGQPTQSVSGGIDYWGFSKVGTVIYGAVLQDMQ